MTTAELTAALSEQGKTFDQIRVEGKIADLKKKIELIEARRQRAVEANDEVAARMDDDILDDLRTELSVYSIKF